MTLFDRLSGQGRRTHARTVFEEQDQSLSLAQLLERTVVLGTRLRSRGIEPGDRVAILVDRGIDAATAIYATLHVGACYVPVDSSSPVQRRCHIVQDAGCRLVVGAGPVPGWLAGIGYLDLTEAGTLPAGRKDTHRAGPEEIAAILYTSGSTGMPKGVAIPHRALLAFAEWGRETFGLDDSDRIASLTPFHFDLSLFDLFTGPCAGATTRFMPDLLKLSPARLVDWLSEHRITTWYTVPSILGFLAHKGGLEKRTPRTLKRILFAGEVFPMQRLKALVRLLPDTAFFNLFGPTETNVCLYWPVDPDRLADARSIPVGIPACGAEARVDPQRGELLVRGRCVMSGYWRDGSPQLPVDGEGWFATGDRVAVNANGEFEFHGRLDRMIKCAGYRIEPAEIEQVLNRLQQVAGSAVVGLEDTVSGSRIVAAVAGSDLGQQTLRTFASAHLPPWMRPTYYLLLDRLPALPNGKTDYQRVRRAIEQEIAKCLSS